MAVATDGSTFGQRAVTLASELHTVFEGNMSGLRYNFLYASGGLLLILLALAPAGPVIGIGAAPLALPALVFGAPLAAIGGVGGAMIKR